MKILFGVPEKIHKEIAEAEVTAFKKLGYNVEVSYYGNSDRVKDLPRRLLLILKNAINLKRKLLQQKSDIVYLNTAFDNKTLVRDSISIFILKLYNRKIKIVLKAHGTKQRAILSKSPFKKYLLRNIDLLLVLSQEELQSFKELSFKKIGITANPIDFTQYDQDKYFRKQEEIEQETILLLFVGRFIKEKGILELIEACRLLKEETFPFKLFCLGNGPLFGEIKQLIKDFKLDSEIMLAGHIPEEKTKYYYSNCDILISPSYREGFPMAIFQAIAAGKSIITTRVNACSDYLNEYENCLWIKKNNPEDIAIKIKLLTKNLELREIMKTNNLLLAKKFTSDKIVANIHPYLMALFNLKR